MLGAETELNWTESWDIEENTPSVHPPIYTHGLVSY